MRLTRKDKWGSYWHDDIEVDIEHETYIKREVVTPVGTKLGKLEDIEDEYGIDLITLFKALKNGIYVKDLKGKIHFVRPHLRMVTNTHLGLEFQCPIKWRYIQLPEDVKYYGKTWALTKEEL